MVCKVLKSNTPFRMASWVKNSRTIWVMSRSWSCSFVLPEMVSKGILMGSSFAALHSSYPTHSESQIDDGHPQGQSDEDPSLETLDHVNTLHGSSSVGPLPFCRENPE